MNAVQKTHKPDYLSAVLPCGVASMLLAPDDNRPAHKAFSSFFALLMTVGAMTAAEEKIMPAPARQ